MTIRMGCGTFSIGDGRIRVKLGDRGGDLADHRPDRIGRIMTGALMAAFSEGAPASVAASNRPKNRKQKFSTVGSGFRGHLEYPRAWIRLVASRLDAQEHRLAHTIGLKAAQVLRDHSARREPHDFNRVQANGVDHLEQPPSPGRGAKGSYSNTRFPPCVTSGE